MVYKWIQKAVEKAVKDYFDRLPDDKIVSAAAKVIGAQGLTEGIYKKLIETASGDRTVSIYFGDGAYAVISSTAPTKSGGIGW